MLDYFSNKKQRKERQEGTGTADSSSRSTPAAGPVEEVPVLDGDEQKFLENLTAHWGASDNDDDVGDNDDDGRGERPPLPPRIKTPDLTWDSDSESFVREERLVAVDDDTAGRTKGKTAVAEKKRDASPGRVGRRLSALFSSRKGKGNGDKAPPLPPHPAHLVVPGQADVDAAASPDTQLVAIAAEEEARERDDLVRVLDDLDLAAKGGPDAKDKSKASKFAVSLSAESAELVRRFVVVLKDLVHGVPTAADDLRGLLDDRDGALARGFERLPSGLRKLVAQLPSKLTSSLAPELLAAAAASQGIEALEEGEHGGVSKSGAAKALLLPLVTKPTALVKMLKAIMNALKLRWPAFIGTSAIWSVALFLLLFVLWYCHKRGREVRLGKEASDASSASAAAAGDSLAEEGGEGSSGEPPIVIRTTSPEDETTTPVTSPLPRPPIGADAPR